MIKIYIILDTMTCIPFQLFRSFDHASKKKNMGFKIYKKDQKYNFVIVKYVFFSNIHN